MTVGLLQPTFTPNMKNMIPLGEIVHG